MLPPNRFARRSRALLAAALAVLAISACQDKRLRELATGISKDSALKILADGVPANADTIQNVYRHSQYLVDSKLFDIYMFDSDNRKLWTDPEVADKELTPIVVINDKVDGWGWDHMDDITFKYHIQVRADTTQAAKQ